MWPVGGGLVLELAGISKRYGAIEAVIDVDLRLEAGEIVGLLGPNGAGKTSVLSIAVGLRRPDAGTARVDGLDPVMDSDARARIGFAPQTTGVYPTLTVADNLRLYGRLAGLSRKQVEERIAETATALDLLGLLGRKGEALSGGERRRVHVAGAVVSRPRLVILDEATAGVDVDARRQLIEFVHKLAYEGAAVLYSTHYLQEIDRDDLRLVILDRGRIIAEGDVKSLLGRHGYSAVEFSFEGPAPDIALPFPVTRQGQVLRVRTDSPTEVAAEVMRTLGVEAKRLTGLEISRPSLDNVFAELTGRSFGESVVSLEFDREPHARVV
jgi:ABC-2 type transport system ATP-binding protein